MMFKCIWKRRKRIRKGKRSDKNIGKLNWKRTYVAICILKALSDRKDVFSRKFLRLKFKVQTTFTL